MNNWTRTAEWCRYGFEAPSCGATLRVFKSGEEFLLVRADAWTGDFTEEGVLSRHASLEEAASAMYAEALSCD